MLSRGQGILRGPADSVPHDTESSAISQGRRPADLPVRVGSAPGGSHPRQGLAGRVVPASSQTGFAVLSPQVRSVHRRAPRPRRLRAHAQENPTGAGKMSDPSMRHGMSHGKKPPCRAGGRWHPGRTSRRIEGSFRVLLRVRRKESSVLKPGPMHHAGEVISLISDVSVRCRWILMRTEKRNALCSSAVVSAAARDVTVLGPSGFPEVLLVTVGEPGAGSGCGGGRGGGRGSRRVPVAGGRARKASRPAQIRSTGLSCGL